MSCPQHSMAGPFAFLVVAGTLLLFEGIVAPQKPPSPAQASATTPSKTTSASLPMSFPISTAVEEPVRLQGDYVWQAVRLDEIRLQQIADNFNSRVELLDSQPSFGIDIDRYVEQAMDKIQGIIARQNQLLASAGLGESETLLRRALLTQAQKQLFVIKAFKDEQAACGDKRFE